MYQFFTRPCYPMFSELIRSRATAIAIALIGGLQLLSSLVGLSYPCPLHATTGIPCAGCGLTRSVRALLHGHIGESLAWHPLGPVLFLGLALAFIAAALPVRRRDSFLHTVGNIESQSRAAYFFLLILLTVWILRIAGIGPLTHI